MATAAQQVPTVSGKSGKQPVLPLAEETSLIRFGVTAGYYSHYLFRGLDVGYRTGIDKSNDSAFFGSSASMSIGDFALGFWYMNSLDSYVPGGAGFDGSFGKLSGSRNNRVYANPLDFRTPARERYQEYDLFANYTIKLADDLAITPGMNFYFFSDGRFWASGKDHVDSTMEAAMSLTYTGIPHLVQNLNYYYDFDAFKGGYLEYKVATKPITLYEAQSFAVGLIPSLTVSYDFKYNGTNNGWNNIEPGIDIPIKLADGLTLNLGARYALDLGDASRDSRGRGVDRTDDRLYFSAALQFAWDSGTHGQGPISGQGDAADFSEPAGPWTIAAGAGMRSINAGFNVSPAPQYNMNSLFRRKTGGGDLGFATAGKDANYLDGSVFSKSSTQYDDGTADFSYKNTKQVTDDGQQGTVNARQVTYTSDRYSYSQSNQRNGFSSSDGDQPVYPYINLTREIARWDRLSVSAGFGYSFATSDMQSGDRLVGLQTVTENHNTYFFTYDFDEIFSETSQSGPFDTRGPNNDGIADTNNLYLIYDGQKYADTYATGSKQSPQQNSISTAQEIARVAIYRGASLDVDMHSISAPFELSYQVTPKLALSLSGGPTLNIFNVNLETDTFYQQLDTVGGTRVTSQNLTKAVHASPATNNVGVGTVVPGVGGSDSTTSKALTGGSGSTATISSGTQTTQTAATGGGGKGSSEGTSRGLPGKTLAHVTNRYAGQEIQWGVYGELALKLDMDARKRWFMEMFARYDYVPKFSVSDGATSAQIDASSWGAGIGVGYRF